MGYESQIELWSPNLTTFCFAGFGTDRLRCQEAMKTAGRENPNRRGRVPRNRAHGAEGQNSSRSIRWAEKQEKFQPMEMSFFLTSSFIELTRSWLWPSGRDFARTPNRAPTLKMVTTLETTELLESQGHRRSGVRAILRQ